LVGVAWEKLDLGVVVRSIGLGECRFKCELGSSGVTFGTEGRESSGRVLGEGGRGRRFLGTGGD